MHKSKRLATILKVKEREEQSLAVKLAEIGGLLSNEKAQLNNLVEYKAEYMSDLDDMVSKSVTVGKLLNKKQFITKLDQAVSNQALRIKKIQHEWDSQVKTWNFKKHEITSWEQLISDAKKDEQLVLDKAQQKELDDLHATRRRPF